MTVADEPQPKFAVDYEYRTDRHRDAELLARHRTYMDGLKSAGSVVASGPLSRDGNDSLGALLILSCPSFDQAWEIVEDDPFYMAGVLSKTSVCSWKASFRL